MQPDNDQEKKNTQNHEFVHKSFPAPPPPQFHTLDISDPSAPPPPQFHLPYFDYEYEALPESLLDPHAPRTHSGGMQTPPKLKNPSLPAFRKFIIAFPVLVLLISLVATFVIRATQSEQLLPTAGPWNVTLFTCQMILLTIAICFTPTVVGLLFRRSKRIASLLIECFAYLVILLVFAFWLLGTKALGTWLFYSVALVLLIEVGSSYLEWYKDNTLRRIRNATLYQSIEIDVQALEKMNRDEVVLYIPVPVGLILGTLIGLILRQTTVQVLALCLQIVLLLSSFVLLYFLAMGFLRMADPLFKTIPKFLPPLTKSKQQSKGKAKASQVSQETLDQHYVDLACDVSGLRMVYKYDALHNTILLVAFLLIVMKVWLFPIDIKWLIASLLFATLVFCELPYAVGQYLLHTKILAQYTGGKYVEMAKKLQEYAPIFPPWAFLGALLTSGTAGGILYALLSQMIQNTLTGFLK